MTDELVVQVVESRLAKADCEPGFIFDGFPRTLPQARALDGVLEIRGAPLEAVLSIEVPDEDVEAIRTVKDVQSYVAARVAA